MPFDLSSRKLPVIVARISLSIYPQRKYNMPMITQHDILADLHVHTIASVHAYSTLRECLEEARLHGMSYLAITDHYYGQGSEVDKKNESNYMSYIEDWANPNKFGVKVIGGGEFNVGHDIFREKRLMEDLHWKLYGLHSWFIDRENTTLEVLFQYFGQNASKFDAFAHIERELHKIDHSRYGRELTPEIQDFLKRLVILAKEKDIVLEVNEGTLARKEAGAPDRLEYWLSVARENGNRISLGTDAHYCELIGNFRRSIALLNKLEYPKELIVNCNMEQLDALLPAKFRERVPK